MAARDPDLIIGVDFGMTCTGVSYANFNRSKTAVRTIQNWPGRMQANENKVTTILSYSRSTRHLSKWGFEAESPLERENPDREAVDWFKVLLDESSFNQMRNHDNHVMPESLDVVEGWFIDYLGALYRHIEYKLSSELPLGKSWSNALIEFIFSVPTTWQPHPTVERFRAICARAGFSQHRSHSIAIGLTEAEAAAVHTSIEAPGLFKPGEVLLVCDIGGGTTDLSVLKVNGIQRGNIQLEQMDVVQGRTIGSAKIDEAFQSLAMQRLSAANSVTPFQGSSQDVSWSMMKSREFQNAKCDFGSPDDTPVFVVPTFGIDPSYTNPSFNMINGAMHFARADMLGLFDAQVIGLYELIDKQISRFKSKHPHEKISHIILSGGLGNSAHVQERLKQKYSYSEASSATMQVHVAPEPQLAVCKGIVADRISTLTSGQGVLPWRCARASYGMLCKVKYDPTNPRHQGRRREADPYTKEIFLTSCIEWFIKKGEAVNSSTPIVRPFTKKIPPGPGSHRTFLSSIVISHVEANQLPFQVNQDAHIVAEVTSDLSGIPEHKFKLKNRHWWNTGRKYRRCEYDVKVIVGAADILFELWFEGRKLSKDKPMPVEWMDTPTPSGGIGESSREHPELPAMSRSRQVAGGAFRMTDQSQLNLNPLPTSSPPTIPIHSVTPVPTQSSIHSTSPVLTHSMHSSPGLTYSVQSTSTGAPRMMYPSTPSVPELMNSANSYMPQMVTTAGHPVHQMHELPQMTRIAHEMPQHQGTVHELALMTTPVQAWMPTGVQMHELPSNMDVNKHVYQQVQEVQPQTGYPVQFGANY